MNNRIIMNLSTLNTRNQYLEILANPDYDTVYCDLYTLSILPPEYKKVTVYTEDDEARLFKS